MTKEEIKAASKEYMIKVKAQDIENGYDVHDLRYSDLKFAFQEGAEWAHSQLVQKGITPEELDDQIYIFNCATVVVSELFRRLQHADNEKIEDLKKEISKLILKMKL